MFFTPKKPISGPDGRPIDFMKSRNVVFAVSLVAILTSLLMIGTRGINYGIDFLGGLKLTYRIVAEQPVTDGAILSALQKGGVEAQVQSFGNSDDGRFMVKVKQPGDNTDKLVDTMTAILVQKFGKQVLLEGEESGRR